MHASNSELVAAEFTSIERSQCNEVMHEVCVLATWIIRSKI